MKAILSNIWLLFLSISILLFSRGVFNVLIGVRLEDEGYSVTAIAIVQSMFLVGFLFSVFTVPKILKKVGHIRVFSVCASFTSIVPLIQLLYVDPILWSIAQLIFGFGVAGAYIVIEGWINEATPNEYRGKIFGIYTIITFLTTAIAPLIIGPISPSSPTIFLLASILSSLAFVPVALMARWTPSFETVEMMKFSRFYKRTPYGVISFGVSMFVYNILFSMFAVYTIKVGMELSVATTSYLVMGITSIITIYGLGYISDKMDRRYIIILTSFLGAVSLFGIMIAGQLQDELIYLVAAGLSGAFIYPLYSLIISHINDRLKPTEITSAASWTIFIGSVCGFAGLIVTGPIMDYFGENSFPTMLMALLGFNVIYGLYRLTQREAVDSEDQGQFVNIPAGGTSTTLDDELFVDYTEVKVKKKKKHRKSKSSKKRSRAKAKKRMIKRR